VITDGPQTFLVERYAADLSVDQLLLAGRRAEDAARLLAPGARARYIGSLLLPSDEMALCLFEGTSEEVVRGALELALLAFERITPAVLVNPRSGRARRRPSDPTFIPLRTRPQARSLFKETPR